MDKASILNALNSTGEVNTFRRTNLWEKAFDAYNSIHGASLRPSCGSCFRTVLAWLRS